MESLNKAEGIPHTSFEDLTSLMSEIISNNQETLGTAFVEVATDYGETFSAHSLEDLFSADNFSRFFDDNNGTSSEWKARQIGEIYRLGNELNSATDDVSKSQIAKELIDYLVNV